MEKNNEELEAVVIITECLPEMEAPEEKTIFPPIVLFDLEIPGRKKDSSICECAAIDIFSRKCFRAFVLPDQEITSHATKIHGYTRDQLINCFS